WTNPFETKILSRFMGYTDCLEAESNIKLFVNWLRKMTLISLQKNKPIGELTATLEAISNFMKSLVGNNQEVSIFYDFERDEVIVELGDTQLPLRLMSSGYRSLIGMVADIAFRMSLLNPQLKEKASLLTPGVILIDELDLHLHPKWQWKIVEDLKRTFPNVQFIATTHAPIIISSCKNGEIINITGDKYEKSHNFGWQVKDVLSEIMDSDNRSPIMQEKISAYEKLYEKKMNESLNEQEKEMLISLEKEMLIKLPESDPIITLTKLNAIKNKVTKVDENS
ncbi:MAG: AAA family ATPase, partial [Planococcus donghaensis]